MVRIVDSIVCAMGEDRSEFWADCLPLADELIHQRQTIVARVVAAKRKAAEDRLEELIRGLDPHTATLVLASRSRQRWFSDHDEPTPCPVCGQEAWLLCGLIEGEPEADGENGLSVPRTAFPTALECSVCGFALEGTDELAVLSLQEDIELDPRDYNESDFEPPDRFDDE